MFQYIELEKTIQKAKDAKELLKDNFQRELENAGMSTYRALYNEDFDLVVRIKRDVKRKFDDDAMANDYNTTKADIKKKDSLIKLTEDNKLTLNKFNEYFYNEHTTDITVKKKKISTKEKTQRGG